MAGHTGTPKSQQLGSAIRDARETTGRGLREVAKELKIDPSRLSKIELGKVVPKADVVGKILEHLGVPADEQTGILALVDGADTEEPWVATTLPEQRRHLGAVVDFEDVAEKITEYTFGLIPGLLQTKAYARAIMVGDDLPAAEASIRVMTRLGRQGVLSQEREQPAKLVALIHATALRQNIGGPDVMCEQLKYLIEMAKRPNVELLIVPDGCGWHPGLETSFTLIDPRADADLYPVVFLEYRRSGLILHADEDVAAYRTAAGSLLRLAMTPTGSVEVIAGAIKEMRTG